MTVWDDLIEDFAMMDRERGYKEPYGAPDIKAALMEAKEEGRLEELLSTPGWEVWRPDDIEDDSNGEDVQAIKETESACITHDSLMVGVSSPTWDSLIEARNPIHTLQEKILLTEEELNTPCTFLDFLEVYIDRRYPGDFPLGPYSMGCNKNPLNFHEYKHKVDATLTLSKKLTEASRKMAERHLLPLDLTTYSEVQSRLLGAEVHSATEESMRIVLQKDKHLLDALQTQPKTRNDSVVFTSTRTRTITGVSPRLEMVVSFFNEEGDVEAMTASDLMAKSWMVEKRYGYINTRKPHPHAAAWVNKPVPSRTGSQEDIARVKDLGWAEIQRNLREWPYGLTLATYSDHCADTGIVTVILRWE